MASGPKFRKKLSEYPGMVNWFSPGVLIQSGLLSVISGTFGHYADKRVTQYLADNVSSDGDVTTPDELVSRHDYSGEANGDEAFWVDYIADLGDGFDSTYSMAYLLAQKNLYGAQNANKALGVNGIRNLNNAAELPHGRLLIMGGDQCYPVPGPAGKEYVDRLITPYTMALPENNSDTPRDLFAIPGNHDWYDGLLAFDRIFCSTREAERDMPGLNIGAWQTRQHRSYFAIKLPHNWWIWGADIQLSETLDSAQLKYFHTVGRSLTEDDKIIICTAQHSWYAENREDAVSTLEQLEDIMRPAVEKGAHLRAVIAGDSHHYSRYFSEETDFHMLTAGGGGAFLHPTHHLRSRVKIGWRGRIHNFTLRNKQKPVTRKGEATAKDPAVKTTRGLACYPTKAKSKRLILRNFAFPLTNKLFSLALGAVYWVMTWFISETNVTDKLGQVLGNKFPSTAEYMQYAFISYLNGDTGLLDLAASAVTGFFAGVVNSPTVSAVGLLIWFALMVFADFKSWVMKAFIGTLHFIAHMVAMMVVYAFVSYFIAGENELNEVAKKYLGQTYIASDTWQWVVGTVPLVGLLWEAGPIVKALAFPIIMVPIGGLLGGLIFGFYLWFNYRWLRSHWNDTFSALAIDDYKNFLRMKFEPTKLTIYPIGLDKVARRRTLWNFWRRVNWRFAGGKPGKGTMVIPNGSIKPHLIEGPIVIGHKLPESYDRQIGGTPDKYAPGLDLREESKTDRTGILQRVAGRSGASEKGGIGKVVAAAAAAVGAAGLAGAAKTAGNDKEADGKPDDTGSGKKKIAAAKTAAPEEATGVPLDDEDIEVIDEFDTDSAVSEGGGEDGGGKDVTADEVPDADLDLDRAEDPLEGIELAEAKIDSSGSIEVAEATALKSDAEIELATPESGLEVAPAGAAGMRPPPSAKPAKDAPSGIAAVSRSVHDRLAKSRDEMKPHYQAVVVGSGYGGGIAAARLARAGKSVCVLERGREIIPGEFPDRVTAGAKQVQVTRGGRHFGDELGLFDIRLNDDLNVVVGCGLGGTSLINANVSILPDARVFDDPVWPRALVNDGLMKPAVERAREMLRPDGVVGSGYGGGIAAARLARAGKSVCVLERGREIIPGEFPDRVTAGAKQVQVTRGGRHFGDELGLFDIRLNDDLNVVVGCGLGGTSLINANVSILPDARVFDDPVWPRALVNDGLMKPAVERAREMLRPVETPADITPEKLNAFKQAADTLGYSCERAKINVSFKDHVNAAGVKQPACTLCGDCVSGCNVGSKNTINMTYLPDAKAHGAEIFTECRVRFLRHAEGVWHIVFTTPEGRGRRTVTADTVVLAAGTLGSTEILLRSRDQGLALSQRLGKGMSGNGDVLAFAYNNDVPVNGIGVGYPPRVEGHMVGPCIAGLVDLRDGDRLEDGMIIEEGSLPSLMGPMLPTLFTGGSLLFGEDRDFDFSDELSEAGRALESLVMGAYSGAIANSQTFLVMSHDDGAGEMVLDDDRLKVNWPGVARQKIFERVDEVLGNMTEATGGTYIKNPLSRTILGENLVTVHPLGGCCMASDRNGGVVNDRCQVFDGAADAAPDAVHEGLYVCDGSVIPRPLGVNPLLTISGVAERAMMLLLDGGAVRMESAGEGEAGV